MPVTSEYQPNSALFVALSGLVESVFFDRNTHVYRIQPRGDEDAQMFKKFLSSEGINFKTTSGYSDLNDKEVESFSVESGKNDFVDRVFDELSSKLQGVNNLLRQIKHYDPMEQQKQVRKEADKRTALDKLKADILYFEKGIRSSDGGSYYYFYFAPDKLDEAEKLFQQVGMAAIEPHKSRFGGKEQTVLRYPDTMLNGEELEVINALTRASRERRVLDDRQKDRASLEQGKQQIDAMSELKKLVTKIDRVKYGAESQELYYYFYSSNLDEAQKLFSQLGVETEQYYSRSSKIMVLRVPRKNIAPYIVVELQKAIATRGIMPNTPQRGRFTI